MTPPDSPPPRRATQFDEQLLPASHASAPAIARNHGRQLLVQPDGATHTAMAYGGDNPVLRLWQDRRLLAEHPLDSGPTAPILVADNANAITVWLSLANQVHHAADPVQAPTPVAGWLGAVEDAVALADGATLLAVNDGGQLSLALWRNGTLAETCAIDYNAGHACLDLDEAGNLHLACEKDQGIEYRCYSAASSLAEMSAGTSCRAAEAYGFHPVVLAHAGVVILAYLGESCRLPGESKWDVSWQRLGRGGYVAALVLDDGKWRRHRLADSQQIVERLRPIDEAYGGGPNDELRVRIEEYSAPTLTLGPDGVPQALWANVDRRWVYASRFLGGDFSPATEVRGPLEQLTGPCLAPRRAAAALPLAVVTRPRTYLDAIALAPRQVVGQRRIDFLQADELRLCQGLELVVGQMQRHPANPVIAKGEAGSIDDAGLVADIFREGDQWRAEYFARNRESTSRAFAPVGLASSADGIEWTKEPPRPLGQRFTVDGAGDHQYAVRFLEDLDEADPERRFKGFYRVDDQGPWAWAVVVSADGSNWTRLETGSIVRADDDLRLIRDPEDAPSRSWKATAISRSHCGRVCAMWTSADGIHWEGERDTLDFGDPFGAKPDRAGTGRVIVEAWAGPEDEDELHGGYLMRDGERLLCHYMKWTADGHIYAALASSRDGLNFSRVGGGASTLPLGAAGTWDAGRVALREAPFRVGDVWRQYYTGCGWKHGLGGVGAKTSPVGFNCPNQMGCAEIQVGRWGYLQVVRGEVEARLETIALDLARPMQVVANAAGLDLPGSLLACEVVDPAKGAPFNGFDIASCDPLEGDDGHFQVTWRGTGLAELGPRSICLRAQLRGGGVKLYGFDLEDG